MKYNLKKAVETLLDPNKPVYDRVVELYRFKVAVLFSRSFGADEQDDENIRGGSLSFSNAHIYARRFAICKILTYIERLHDENSENGFTLLQLRKNSADYKRLSDKLINQHGGWRGLLSLPSVKEFDKKVRDRQKGAEAIAMALDFSSRYTKNPTPRLPKNFRVQRTRALNSIIESPEYEAPFQIAHLNTLWKEHRNGAGFLCLQHFHQQKLVEVPRVTKISFVPKLLAEAEYIPGLQKLFANYEELAQLLERARYQLPRTGVTPTQSDLSFSALPVYTIDDLVKSRE